MTDRRESDLMRPGLPGLGNEIDFLRLIWAVDHGLQRRSKYMEASLGITGPQRLALRIIGRFPSIHAKQLAEILHVHPSSLTALLKRLERRGLVYRRPNARDRRRLLLGLTRRGQELNRRSPGTVEEVVQRMLGKLSKRDIEGARVVLATLAKMLDEEPAPAARKPTRSRSSVGRARPRSAGIRRTAARRFIRTHSRT